MQKKKQTKGKAVVVKKKNVVKKNNAVKAKKVVKKAEPKSTSKKVVKKTVAKKPVKKALSALPGRQAGGRQAAPKKAVAKKTVVAVKKAATKKTAVLPKKEIKKTEKKKPTKQEVKQKISMGSVVEKIRYSDEELLEFKGIILKKLEEAHRDLALLTEAYTTKNEHDTNDTSPTFKVLEEGSNVLSKEENSQLAARQKKFIRDLENALIRIENKTYGICRVTGKLIPKERLRVVPHATMSIEAKLQQPQKR